MWAHDMEVVMVPLSELAPHPRNPNNGNIDLLEESVEINGFYDPIKVQRSTGLIIAGNHRYLVAIGLNATELPVIYLDVDDEQAMRIMLADNQITRRGFDDPGELLSAMEGLYATDLALHGTGFTVDDMNRLTQMADEPLSFDSNPVVDRREEHSNTSTRFSVIPISDSDGKVYELSVQLDGMGPISVADANGVRRALGLEPFGKDELRAFDLPEWK